MGRILGIDYGDSRIGLAISDRSKSIAFPFKTIKNKNLEFLLKFFKNLIIIKKIELLVIGLPIGMNGKETDQTKKVRSFAESMKVLGIPICFQDERLSSISAKKSLIKEKIKTGYKKEKIDERAASIFLQQFIDHNNVFIG